MTEENEAAVRAIDVASLKNYLGPYEAWNFGVGNPYAFPAFRRDDIRYLTALAELPSKQVPTSGTGGPRRWFPTLWGVSEGVPLKFWPMVIDNPLGRMAGPRDIGQCVNEGLVAAGVSSPRFRMAFPVADSAMHETAGAFPSDPVWSPDPCVEQNRKHGRRINILGVIEDGIPFAHRNFRAADGKRTRLEFCWLQSANKDPDVENPTVICGREYTRDEIENLIRDHGEDEDALYHAAGATSDVFELGAAINRHATHGAHIMDVAGGYDPNGLEEPPEETRLIAVQLPNTIAWDTSSFAKDMYMLAAVHYILERAERIADGYNEPDIRVAINFSYGFSGARHDGESELAAAINEIVTERRKLGRPTVMVLPSGNTFMDQLHGEISADDFKQNEFAFSWVVQPNDRTSSYLEIWFPGGVDPAGFVLELKGPFGKTTAALDLTPDPLCKGGDPRRFELLKLDRPSGSVPIGQLSVDNHRTTGHWRAMIALAPSDPEEMDLPAAPAGIWTVKLKRGQGASASHPPLYVWVQRDADPDEFRSGSRQSYLRDLNYRKFSDLGEEAQDDDRNSHVRRFGTLNSLATGQTSLIVSGCRPVAGTGWDPCKPVASTYSSAGKVDPSAPVGSVDCTAPADRSNISLGILAAGTRSGSYALVQGTSVAAPLVARRLSEAFATAPDVVVKNAEDENYLPIVEKTELSNQTPEERARLGKYLVT